MEGRLEPYYVGICMLGEEIGVLFFRVNSSYVCLCLCLGLACLGVNLEKVKSDSLYFFVIIIIILFSNIRNICTSP